MMSPALNAAAATHTLPYYVKSSREHEENQRPTDNMAESEAMIVLVALDRAELAELATKVT